jgi:hypothetical protein
MQNRGAQLRVASPNGAVSVEAVPDQRIERFYTEQELSEAGLGSRSKLAHDRMDGTGIPFFYLGRAVRYRESDVNAWLDANRKTHALQTPPAKRGGRPKRR